MEAKISIRKAWSITPSRGEIIRADQIVHVRIDQILSGFIVLKVARAEAWAVYYPTLSDFLTGNKIHLLRAVMTRVITGLGTA